MLAVQGPRSRELVEAMGLPTDHDYMSFAGADWQGRPVVVCRTGYTGELGFELLPRWDDAGEVWDAVLEAGAGLGVLPCGLGARDTLRTEMGYPLHGQDLSLEITPVQARSGWAVGWDKPRFWGRDALLAERAAGPHRLLRGLESLDRGIPRAHMRVQKDGAAVGEVTSGTFSPTRRVGIGLALLDRAVAEGDEVTVDVRGRTSTMRVVKPPFVAVARAMTRVLLVGLMATGKSTVGRAVADATGWPCLDNDALLEQDTGQTAAQILAEHGEARLRAAESDVLARLVALPGPFVAGVAAGTILDEGDRARMRAAGHVVWLRTSVATIVQRVQGQTGRAWLDEDPEAVLTAMAAERDPLYASVAHQVLEMDDLTPEQAARQVVAALPSS